MLTGTVVVDLTDGCKREQMRHRVDALNMAPTGVRAVIRVGALAPEPEAVRVVARHEPRLCVDLEGTVSAVRLWIDAIRDAESGVLL